MNGSITQHQLTTAEGLEPRLTVIIVNHESWPDVLQLTAALSLFGGGAYGRVVGIVAATIGAVGALLSVGGAYPFWSLGIFAICLIVIHGLAVLGEPKTA